MVSVEVVVVAGGPVSCALAAAHVMVIVDSMRKAGLSTLCGNRLLSSAEVTLVAPCTIVGIGELCWL